MLVKEPVLKKIPQKTAIEILGRYQQERSFREQVSPELTPVELINQLYQQKQWQNLVSFLCYALRPTEAIWWGYLCIDTLDSPLTDVQSQTVTVVEHWLHAPDETHRRAAEIVIKQVGLDNPAGWLAQAVFWSGGSITPLDAPENPAPPFLFCPAIAGAISLAAVLPDGAKGEKRYRQFIQMGIDIANGGTGKR